MPDEVPGPCGGQAKVIARRRDKEGHTHSERWVLSWADFVTLLFALFVALYATALKDRSSARAMSASIREALHSGGVAGTLQAIRESPARGQEPPVAAEAPANASLLEAQHELEGQLKNELSAGAVRMTRQARGLVISLQEKPFFASGEDTVNEKTYGTIERIAQVIGHLSNPVRLEGHTDSVPISNSRFRNNWELSSARSIALLQVFQSRFHLPVARFAVSGFADNAPVSSNETEEGRMENRRVEIVLLSQNDR
jgi:chemotaxis protein MotB